jgi:hypothetical protein
MKQYPGRANIELQVPLNFDPTALNQGLVAAEKVKIKQEISTMIVKVLFRDYIDTLRTP